MHWSYQMPQLTSTWWCNQCLCQYCPSWSDGVL